MDTITISMIIKLITLTENWQIRIKAIINMCPDLNTGCIKVTITVEIIEDLNDYLTQQSKIGRYFDHFHSLYTIQRKKNSTFILLFST